MAVIGTFGSFTAARMGIYASQSALNVTGNNIANINTDGYTRQRLDLVSLHSWGTPRYANKMNMDVGYGVLTNGVSQLRDPFIDIRYRDEQSKVGASETWLKCLEQLSHTLDEVGDGDDFGLVERQFNDFKLQLEQLHGAVGTVEYDTTVRSSAEVLCNLLNSYAKALESVENNQIKNLKDDVTAVNSILTQIRDLNTEIREAGIHGAKALELRDARNVLIDELSKYMKIEVSYDMEKIDEFNSVERLSINVADTGNPPIRLICGTYGTQLKMGDKAPMRNPNYNFDDPNALKNAEILKNEGMYISKIDKTVDPPKYEYTNNPVTEEQAKAEWLKTHDDLTGFQEDPANPWALEVNNALAGADNQGDNRLWMSLEPLVNEKGRVFRNSDGEKSEMVELGDNTLYGSFQSMREFITGKGEFSSALDVSYKSNATEVRGVPYYRKSLDAIAQKFAQMFNEANQVDFDKVKDYYKFDNTAGAAGAFVDENGTPITLDGDPIDSSLFDKITAGLQAIDNDRNLTDEQKEQEKQLYKLKNKNDIDKAYKQLEQLRLKGELNPEYAYYNGGVMFSSSGDTNDMTGITAKNITIAKGWSTGEVRILNSKKPDILIDDPAGSGNKVLSHTTANDNVAHMINLMTSKLDYLPQDIYDTNAADMPANSKRYFNGTFQERFADMNVILSVDEQTTTTLYNSYSVKSLSLDNDRQSVSGVDLNDEATNMMMFQKSYSAACQLMTTLDSMLDKLINGTLR